MFLCHLLVLDVDKYAIKFIPLVNVNLQKQWNRVSIYAKNKLLHCQELRIGKKVNVAIEIESKLILNVCVANS